MVDTSRSYDLPDILAESQQNKQDSPPTETPYFLGTADAEKHKESAPTISAMGSSSMPYIVGKSIRITIDHTKFSATQTNFPVMVWLSASSGLGSTDVRDIFTELAADANRKKIHVFISDFSAECYVEIVSWSTTSKQAELWIKVPSISHTADTVLYLIYDATADDNTTYVGDTNDAVVSNVWDANFVFVHHGYDGADNAHVYDSTGNNNDGTKKAADNPQQVAAAIGFGQQYSDSYINVADHASLDIVTALTLENYFKCTDVSSDAGQLFAKATSGSGKDCPYHFSLNQTTGKMRGRIGDGSTNQDIVGNTGVADSVYHHGVFRHEDGGNLELLLNGASDATPISKTITPLTNAVDLKIGKWHTVWQPFVGIIKESRVSNIKRSDAWIAATNYSLRDQICTFVVGNPKSMDIGFFTIYT